MFLCNSGGCFRSSCCDCVVSVVVDVSAALLVDVSGAVVIVDVSVVVDGSAVLWWMFQEQLL